MKLLIPFPKFNGATVEVWGGWVIGPTTFKTHDYLSMLALKLTHVSKGGPWTSTVTISVEHSLVTSFKTNLIPFKIIFPRFNQFNTPAAFLCIESIGLTSFSEIFHTWLSHFYITFIGKRSPMTMLLTIMKRQCVILSLIGQFSFAHNSLYMARSVIFFAQHN